MTVAASFCLRAECFLWLRLECKGVREAEGMGWVLPTAGVTDEAVGMIQASHRLARLPRSIDAKPTLDTNACEGGAGENQLVLRTTELGGQPGSWSGVHLPDPPKLTSQGQCHQVPNN